MFHRFVTKDIIIGNIPADILVWDDEIPKAARGPDHRKLYLSVHCCALTFDVTNAASFEALDKWRARCLRPESHTHPSTRVLPVFGVPYFEVSAKESTNIEEAFDIITRKALARSIQHGPSPSFPDLPRWRKTKEKEKFM
uniref:Uncharacterized protein n=1 Tax=Ditylenchus dipsaci TaxID=166011 RepID=A0A915ECN6_9BILA